MLLKDTATFSISVSEDIYTFTNKTGGDLIYSLYRQDAVKVLISENTVAALGSESITFDGDGLYIVDVAGNETEIRYYLQLQENLLSVIEDFLNDCCSFANPTYDCSCTDPIEVRCSQFASVQIMLLTYKNLVSEILNNSGSALYLLQAFELYENEIRTAYLNHFSQECISGKSLYGSKTLKYITPIYYTLFLETEKSERDGEDNDYIESKFNYSTISSSMNKLGISYSQLKSIVTTTILIIIISLNLSIPIDRSIDVTYTFSSSDFPYTNGNPLGRTHIRINTIPNEGELAYNGDVLGVDLSLPYIIEESNIGNLVYTSNASNTSAYDVIFDYDSSNNNKYNWG